VTPPPPPAEPVKEVIVEKYTPPLPPDYSHFEIEITLLKEQSERYRKDISELRVKIEELEVEKLKLIEKNRYNEFS
jgi:hypothetical protein